MPTLHNDGSTELPADSCLKSVFYQVAQYQLHVKSLLGWGSDHRVAMTLELMEFHLTE